MTIPVVVGCRFSIGKYDVIATPMPHSAHMLRYTVFLEGKRIGSTMSVPTESDCRFLEAPPYVPALVPWRPTFRPGRPKKGTPPRSTEALAAPAEELPHGMSFPVSREEH